MNLELRKAFPFIRISKQSASQTLRPVRDGAADNMLPSLGLAYFLENNVSVFADIVLTLKQEVIRRGLVWKPRFAVKCLLCGTEYNEEKTQCDCGSATLRKPDRTQINKFKNPRGESFVDTANLNDQNLETISGEMVRHWIVADSGYILCVKSYAYISNGGIEKLIATPVEFLALDPREVLPIRQKNGLPGGKIWTCAIHRSEYAEQPGLCKVCAHEMHEALFETAGIGMKKNYYIKDEIFSTSIYYPSISGGYPPILRLLYDAYAYHYMELRTYNYHKKGRPPGFLAFPTSNLESLNSQWNALLTQAQEDPDNVQALGFDPGNGKGVATFVKLMSDPGAEMLEVKKDLRERMGSMFGVSMIFQADTSASGGLNNEGLQITVTNRSVEFLQNPFNGREQNNYKGGLYYWMVTQCGITDFVLHLLPSEEQDEMAEKTRFNQDAQNAKLMLDMGYDVKFESNKFTFSGVAKKAEPPGMFGGMPAPGPAQTEPPRASGEPNISAVGKSDIKNFEESKHPRGEGGEWTSGGGGGDAGKKPESSVSTKLKEGEWRKKDTIKSYQSELAGMDKEKIKSNGVSIQDDYTDMQNYNALKEWHEQNPQELDSRVTRALDLDVSTSRRKGETTFPITENEDTKVQKIYTNTQAFLKDEPDTITVYRGVGGEARKKLGDAKLGDMIEAESYNISSWSEDKGTADSFARSNTGGMVLEAKIPKEQIFLHYKNSTQGIEKEKEVVIIGNKTKAKIVSFED